MSWALDEQMKQATRCFGYSRTRAWSGLDLHEIGPGLLLGRAGMPARRPYRARAEAVCQQPDPDGTPDEMIDLYRTSQLDGSNRV